MWVNITSNLFSLTRPLYNSGANQTVPGFGAAGSLLQDLTSIAVDWRFAVPNSNMAYATTYTLASASPRPPPR